jgi:beta-lactamase class A
LAESESESPKLAHLKEEIQKTISKYTAAGKAARASVYIKELNNGNWCQVNGYDFYYPGSLVKVPILISFLKMAEKEPGLLQEEIILKNPVSNQLIQSTHGEKLVQGKAYSIEKLLHEMIVYSDNDATSALVERVDKPTFLKLYQDLGIQTPDLYDMNFKTSPAEYNRFFRILYNSSYLGVQASEYALELLTKATYDKGIRSQIPRSVIVAHKFGERPAENGFSLHDAALVYSKANPYLLVVMTEGKNMPDLELMIQDIAKTVNTEIK